jgi:azurin
MKKYLFTSLLLALAIGLVACGGEQESSSEETMESESSGEEAMAADDGVRTINLIGTDDMKFVVEEEAEGIVTAGPSGQNLLLESIEAAPGEEIRVTLTTVSNLPPTAMSHNFALLEMGSDADAFARASITARDNDYISPDFADQVIIHTAMLGADETDSITFTVPEEPGEYTFLCTFPGHYAGGMVGTLIVQ